MTPREQKLLEALRRIAKHGGMAESCDSSRTVARQALASYEAAAKEEPQADLPERVSDTRPCQFKYSGGAVCGQEENRCMHEGSQDECSPAGRHKYQPEPVL